MSRELKMVKVVDFVLEVSSPLRGEGKGEGGAVYGCHGK